MADLPDPLPRLLSGDQALQLYASFSPRWQAIVKARMDAYECRVHQVFNRWHYYRVDPTQSEPHPKAPPELVAQALAPKVDPLDDVDAVI